MKPLDSKHKTAYDLINHPQDYLELWKWFSEDTAKVKDKMWTMAAFFYTGLGALLSYIASQASNSSLVLKNKILVLIVSGIGILLSSYATYMIWEYGKHIRTGWNRTNYLRNHINGLTTIWCFGDTEFQHKIAAENGVYPKKIPAIAMRLVVLMGFFIFTFLVLFLLLLFGVDI